MPTIKKSRLTYADTVAQLSKSMVAGGNRIFATIDQSSAAQTVDMTLSPTTLIIFGNPKGGTPFMAAFPLVALDLPLKLLVWEEQGDVSVAYVSMSEIAGRYGVTGLDAQIGAIDHALEALTNSVT